MRRHDRQRNRRGRTREPTLFDIPPQHAPRRRRSRHESTNNKWIVASLYGESSKVCVLDSENGVETGMEFQAQRTQRPTHCDQYSPTEVVVGSAAGKIHVLSLESGEAKTLSGHRGEDVMTVASMQGRRFALSGLIASGGKDSSVELWNVSSGLSRSRLEGHQGPVRRLLYDGSLPSGHLVSAAHDSTVRLWDVTKEVPVMIIDVAEESQSLQSSLSSPESWGSCMFPLQQFLPSSGRSPVRHADTPAQSSKESYHAAASMVMEEIEMNRLRQATLLARERGQRAPPKHVSYIHTGALCYDSTNRILFSGTRGSVLYGWDLRSAGTGQGGPMLYSKMANHVDSILLMPDGHSLVISEKDGMFTITDTRKLTQTRSSRPTGFFAGLGLRQNAGSSSLNRANTVCKWKCRSSTGRIRDMCCVGGNNSL